MIRATLAAAATLLLPAGAAQAQIPATETVMVVSTRGRDLAVAADAKAVYRDVTRAAAEVCGGQRGSGDLAAMDAFDACYAATVRQVVDRLDAPLVTALADKVRAPVRMAGR